MPRHDEGLPFSHTQKMIQREIEKATAEWQHRAETAEADLIEAQEIISIEQAARLIAERREQALEAKTALLHLYCEWIRWRILRGGVTVGERALLRDYDRGQPLDEMSELMASDFIPDEVLALALTATSTKQPAEDSPSQQMFDAAWEASHDYHLEPPSSEEAHDE